MGIGQKVGFRHTEDAKRRISIGMKGKQNGFRDRVSCPDCGQSMSSANLPRHLRSCEEVRRWAHLFDRPQSVMEMKTFRRVLGVYGLTIEGYAHYYERQGGNCAICENGPPEGERLVVDHCHETGLVRGLLCRPCNQMLGMARDKSEVLRRGAEYVALHRASHIESGHYDTGHECTSTTSRLSAA